MAVHDTKTTTSGSVTTSTLRLLILASGLKFSSNIISVLLFQDERVFLLLFYPPMRTG